MKLFQAYGMAHGLNDQALGLGMEGFIASSGGCALVAGHKREKTRPDLQEPLFSERGDDFLCRIGIDAQLLAELAHAREPIARFQASGDDRLLGSIDDLLVDGPIGGK